VNSAEAR